MMRNRMSYLEHPGVPPYPAIWDMTLIFAEKMYTKWPRFPPDTSCKSSSIPM